jgi:hypothetical protein
MARVLLGGIAVVAAIALTGCSTSADSAASPELITQAQKIGVQALTLGSPESTAGWASPTQCSATMQADIRSAVPAGETLTLRDPTTVSGPYGDPTLTQGDVATCAFVLTSPTGSEVQEFFLGMPQSYLDTFSERLVANGFTAGPITSGTATPGTIQVFTSPTARVDLVYASKPPGVVSVFG